MRWTGSPEVQRERPFNPWVAAGWALAFVLVTVGAQGLPGVAESWQFDRAVYLEGAWWQLLSAQGVHWGWLHAAANATGFAVLLLGFQSWVAGHLQALALLGGYAGVAIVVALDAQCARYAGASGALHGLLAGSALAIMLSGLQDNGMGRRAQRLGALVLAALVLKLVLQHGAANPVVADWQGFSTYYPAHEAGALGGLVAVLLAHGLRTRGPTGARTGG